MKMDVPSCFSLCICLVIFINVAKPNPITLVDLSYEFSSKTPTYPTHNKFKSLNLKHVYPNPNSSAIRFAVQDISGSEHAGTHMDAPSHFKDGGFSMEQYPIEVFTGPGVVIDVKESARQNPNYEVTVDDLENWERNYGPIPDNAYVLMNSGWDKFWEDEEKFLGTLRKDGQDLIYPGFSAAACEWLIDNRKINAIGVDTAGADVASSLLYPCHYTMSDKDIIILENVFNLDELPPTGSIIRAYPMKIKGGTGAPTRIIATIKGPHKTSHVMNEL